MLTELKVIQKIGKTLPAPVFPGRKPLEPAQRKWVKFHAQLPKDGSWALVAEDLGDEAVKRLVNGSSYAKRFGVQMARRGGNVYARRIEVAK